MNAWYDVHALQRLKHAAKCSHHPCLMVRPSPLLARVLLAWSSHTSQNQGMRRRPAGGEMVQRLVRANHKATFMGVPQMTHNQAKWEHPWLRTLNLGASSSPHQLQ
jgi:hypothetical protein